MFATTKSKLLPSAIATALAMTMIPWTAVAQPSEFGESGEQVEQRRHRGPHGGPRGGLLFRAADADRDRNITAAEWQDFLIALDGDADGLLTQEEFLAFRQARAAERGVNREPRQAPPEAADFMTRRLDTDGDGQVEVEDLQAKFDSLDANSDGDLTSDELPRRGPRHRGSRGERAGGQFLRLADADQDRQITTAEWQQMVATLDADASGTISREEIAAQRSKQRPEGDRPELTVERLNEMFSQLDSNADGTISSDELPERGPRHRGPRRERGPRGQGSQGGATFQQ